ncbi:hypothetical protein D3C78_725480 [compost metagenome]
MQAVAAKEPQQVAWHQVRDLRIALDDLAHQVLAKIGAFRVDGQLQHQIVEALQKQRVAFFRHLLGFAQGNQDGAQVGEQGEMVFQAIGSHAGSPLEQKRAREYTAPGARCPGP